MLKTGIKPLLTSESFRVLFLRGFLPERDAYHTCTADSFHLLPADLLQAAAEVTQRPPGEAEGLCGQADASVEPTGGEGAKEQRSSLGQEKED